MGSAVLDESSGGNESEENKVDEWAAPAGITNASQLQNSGTVVRRKRTCMLLDEKETVVTGSEVEKSEKSHAG